MYVLITYDVNTSVPHGARRLRQVAKTCEDYGIRVQYSVFECLVDPSLWVAFKAKLLAIINEETDSLRFYFLGKNWKKKVEHHGKQKGFDITGHLII